MSEIFGKNKAVPNYDEGTMKLWSVSELQQFIGASANRGGAFSLMNCMRNGIFEPPNAASIIRAQQLMSEKKSGVSDTFGAFELLSSKGIAVSYEAERILLMPDDGVERIIKNSPVPTQQKVNKALYEPTAILLVSLSKLSKGRIEELFSVAKWEAVLTEGQKEVSIANMVTVVNMFRHIFEKLPLGVAIADAKKTLTGASYASLVIDALSIMPIEDYDALQTTISTELYDVFVNVDGKWKVKTKTDAVTGEATPIIPKASFTQKSTGTFYEQHGLPAIYSKGVLVRVPVYKNISFDAFVKKKQQYDDVCGATGTGANTFLSGFGFAGYPTASMRQVLRKIAMVRGAQKYLKTYDQWRSELDDDLYRQDENGGVVLCQGKKVERTEEDLRADFENNGMDYVAINVDAPEVGLMTAALLGTRTRFLVSEAVLADVSVNATMCVDAREEEDVNLYYFSTAWPTLPANKAKLATTHDYMSRVVDSLGVTRKIIYMPILSSLPWERKYYVSTHGNYTHLEGYISFSDDFSLLGEEKGVSKPSDMIRHESFSTLLDKAHALMGSLVKWIFKPTKIFYDPISNGLKRDLTTTKVTFDSEGELLSSTVMWTPSDAIPEILEKVHSTMMLDVELDALESGGDAQLNFSKKIHPEKDDRLAALREKSKKEFDKLLTGKKAESKIVEKPKEKPVVDDELEELDEAGDAKEL